MKFEIVAVIAGQKLVIALESDDKDVCCDLRRSLCRMIGGQYPDLQSLDVKEG